MSFCSIFQSTPPARGATSSGWWTAAEKAHFNPRPPRGGRLFLATPCAMPTAFQSTPPARGATDFAPPEITAQAISIHAPREGGDSPLQIFSHHLGHFNPRPPRGGRPFCLRRERRTMIFQSTPPARGATLFFLGLGPVIDGISIHAPREGGDSQPNQPHSSSTISIHAPREGGDSKDAQFYLWIFDK